MSRTDRVVSRNQGIVREQRKVDGAGHLLLIGRRVIGGTIGAWWRRQQAEIGERIGRERKAKAAKKQAGPTDLERVLARRAAAEASP